MHIELMTVTWSVSFGRNNACFHYKKRAKWRHLELCGWERECCRTLKIPLFLLFLHFTSFLILSVTTDGFKQRSTNFPLTATHTVYGTRTCCHRDMWSEVINSHRYTHMITLWSQTRLPLKKTPQSFLVLGDFRHSHTLTKFAKNVFNTTERLTS